MARLEQLTGAKVALDTVIFIYALEGNPDFGDRAIKILEMIEQGRCRGFACDLVLAELVVVSLRLEKSLIGYWQAWVEFLIKKSFQLQPL